jgi:hypothetical protein
MNATERLTHQQLRTAAHDAIARELGVVGLIRYLRDSRRGEGNYVEDRKRWLPEYESVDQLWEEMERARVAGLLLSPNELKRKQGA